MPPWKDGATLGVAYARMTTPRDFIEHRVRLQRRMLQLSRQSWRPLPGSRVEVSSIAEVFQRVGGKCVTLIGTDATAHRISELATKGVLRDFDYLLFATHGEVETLSPFDSRIILGSPSADFGLSSVMRFENLRRDVTAREILQQWQLRARVVAISACESGRGPEAGGEGYLGFAQALLLAGADNVVLAMAPVDDTASTLLMHRFFRNLLDGPADAKAMRPAEALHEAKVWLRQSNAGELKTLVTHIGGDSLLLPTTNPSTLPYKDPKYWAPFVLIGSGV